MSVRTRLVAVTVLEIIITLVMVVIIIISTGRSDRSDDQTRYSLQRLSQAQAVAKYAGLQMDHTDDLMISQGTWYEKTDYNSQVNQSFDRWMRSLTGNIRLSGESDLGRGQRSELQRVEGLKKTFGSLADILDQAISMSVNGKPTDAVALASKANASYLSSFLPGLESTILVEQSNAARAEADSKRSSNSARLIPLVVAPIGILLLALTSFLLMTEITGSLKKLEDGAKRLEDGELGARIDTGRDDEFGQVADAFNSMSEELKRTNEDLVAYDHTVSHDLKGPLSTALMAAIMLEEEARSVESHSEVDVIELAGIVNQNIQRAVDLTSDLLRLAEAGQEPPDIERVAVSEVVAQILEEKQPELAGAGGSIEAGPDLGTVLGSRAQIYQLFTNLIDNALKYGLPPGKTPVIKVERVGDKHEGVNSYVVRDNGPGVPDQLLDRLFAPFVKGHSGGTGIGLATVSKIVAVYGDEITVRNEDGAVFEFTLHDLK